MQIVVASFNPVKLQAIANAFSQVFPQISFTHTPTSVLSEVPDQPLTDRQTKLGSITRVRNAKILYPHSQFWVGIEAGIQRTRTSAQSFAWITVADTHHSCSTRTSTFPLPSKIINLINQGNELGDAMDILYQRNNTKQEEGAVGILTHGIVTRTLLYQQAVILALIPFIPLYSTD